MSGLEHPASPILIHALQSHLALVPTHQALANLFMETSASQTKTAKAHATVYQESARILTALGTGVFILENATQGRSNALSILTVQDRHAQV